MKHTLTAVLAVTLGACAGPRPETFPARYADAFCAASRQCFSDDFDVRYEDAASCRDQVAEYVIDVLHLPDGDCPFDRALASECLTGLRRTACDRFEAGVSVPACESVLSACLNDAAERNP